MPRIRTIKPEILRDEKTATLPDAAWRIFIGLFSLADDYGRLHAAAEQIAGSVLWGRPGPGLTAEEERAIVALLGEERARDLLYPGCEKMLSVLEERGLVTRYKVRGQSYLQITNWHKHQRVSHPGFPVVPCPHGAGPGRHMEGGCDGRCDGQMRSPEQLPLPLPQAAPALPVAPQTQATTTTATATPQDATASWRAMEARAGARLAPGKTFPTGTGLPPSAEGRWILVHQEAARHYTLADFARLGAWINAGGWAHLQKVSPQYIADHLIEGLGLAQAWDGQAPAERRERRRPEPPRPIGPSDKRPGGVPCGKDFCDGHSHYSTAPGESRSGSRSWPCPGSTQMEISP